MKRRHAGICLKIYDSYRDLMFGKKIVKLLNPHPSYSYLILPPRGTVESIYCMSLKASLSCPVLLYVRQTFVFTLAKAKKNHRAGSKCLQQLCNPPYNLPVTYTTSDIQASFTQAASIYGQPAADSATVTLHGVAQGVLLSCW